MAALRLALPGDHLGRFIALLLIGLAAAHPALAQNTGAIAGSVVDTRTQQPLADINVVVAGTLFGATTGPQGQFRIASVPPGSYTVQVSALGYRTARRTVEVTAGETAPATFRLTPTTERVREEEVTVEAETLYPQAELVARQLRELNVADAGLALRSVPGAGAVRRGALGFAPNVRGLMEEQIGVYLDGMRSFAWGPLGVDAPLSHIDPSAIDRINVVKGPYALTWGAGNMSAIRVEAPGFEEESDPRGWLEGGFQGNGQAAETAGSLNGAVLGAPYLLQAAYRTGQSYEAGDGRTVPAHYESGAVHGRVDVPLTGISSLSTWGIFQDQRDVSYPGLLLNAEQFQGGQGAVRYRLDKSIGIVRRVEVQAYAGQSLYTLNNDEKPTAELGPFGPALDITVDAELQQYGGRLSTRVVPGGGVVLTLGSDVYHTYRNATRDLRLRDTDIVPPYFTSNEVLPGATITDVGFFANGTRALGPVDASGTVRLDVVGADADRASPAFLANAGGLTIDDLSDSEALWSGALALSTSLSPQWTLGLGVGSVARPAGAFERYVDRFSVAAVQTRAEVQGTPSLDPERSTQGDLWLTGSFERMEIRVGGFVRDIDNYITLEPTNIVPLLPQSPETVLRYVNGTATFYGADASGRYVVNPLLTLFGRASYVWGEDETRDEPALGTLPVTADLGVRIQAPFSEDLFLEGITHLATEDDRVATTRGEVPTDGYATLDVRLGFAPAARTSLIFSIENVTDAYYVYPLNARNPFTGRVIPEPGRRFGLNLRVLF